MLFEFHLHLVHHGLERREIEHPIMKLVERLAGHCPESSVGALGWRFGGLLLGGARNSSDTCDHEFLLAGIVLNWTSYDSIFLTLSQY